MVLHGITTTAQRYTQAQQTAVSESKPTANPAPPAENGENRHDGPQGIRLPEDRVNLSGRRPEADPRGAQTAGQEPPVQQAKPGERTTADGRSLEDPQIRQAVEKLKQIEVKVKAHEAAHKAAGGNLASSATYSYSQGPDGRSYITGGEVQIDMSPGRTPQETINKMQQVIRAALAPADPSGQDRAVAAQAANQMAQAQQQKLQAESPTAEPTAAEPPDPAREAIRTALQPRQDNENPPAEPSVDRMTPQSTGQPDRPARSAQVRQAYSDPTLRQQPSAGISSYA